MNKQVDYIIVGQGLAGSILALTLLKQGKSVVVMDEGKWSTSSRIAAGIYNPVVFKRLVKSWMADDLLPYMDEFYPEMERLLGSKFYFSRRILKPFAEDHEKVLWIKKTEEAVGKYLNKTIEMTDLNGLIQNPIGMSEVLSAGNLDVLNFLDACKSHLKSGGNFWEEKLDHEQLKFSENGVAYKALESKKLIFCEGHFATENPYFNWLPFKLTKGETLTIQLSADESIPENTVINKAVFILPLGNNTYKVGATYEWQDLSEETTEKGRKELVEKLQKVLKVPFEIISQQAGVRPTVNDRRPLIGLHPKTPQLGIFNGLGTKGVMLAPFFALQFANFLQGQAQLDKEVDIARFKA